MALTLNGFWGAETGGLEEALASNVGGVVATAGAGEWAYSFDDLVNSYTTFDIFAEVADAGGEYIIGIELYTPDVTPAVDDAFLAVSDTGPDVQIALGLNSSGQIIVYDSALTSYVIAASPGLQNNTLAYIELHFQHSNSGTAEVFVDGVSKGSVSGKDFLNGNIVRLEAQPVGHVSTLVDHIYFMSGATSSADCLGPTQVLAYESAVASTTADWIKGSDGDLNSGTWKDAQGVPFVEANAAIYNDRVARAGGIDTNDVGGSAGTGGPNTDTLIDGTIVGMKGVWRIKTSGGSGSTHFGLIGNTGSAIVDADRTVDLDPTTAYANFFEVRETNLPLSTEYGRIGFEKDAGGQDLDCADMLFQILHVPAVGGPTPISADADSVGTSTAASNSGAQAQVDGDSTAAATAAANSCVTIPTDINSDGTATAQADIIDANLASDTVASAAGVATTNFVAQIIAQTTASTSASAVVVGNTGSVATANGIVAGTATLNTNTSAIAGTINVINALATLDAHAAVIHNVDADSAGSAAVIGQALFIFNSVASSDASATVNADTLAIWATDTSSIGEATASADSGALSTTTVSTAGTSTVLGDSSNVAATDMNAAGTASISALADSLSLSDADSAGTSTVQANTGAQAQVDADSAGNATLVINATDAAAGGADADSAGTSTAQANTSAFVPSEINSAGTATAQAITPAIYEQEGYRFRNDDGTEITATWMFAQDIDITTDKLICKRLRILTDATGDPDTAQVTLQYREVGGIEAAWRSV